MTFGVNGNDGADVAASGVQATRVPRGPSPIFLGLLAVAGVSGWLLFAGIGDPGLVTFLFVLAAWVVTLSLHEFFHALVAFRNGDVSVVHRGYLTLDPLRYTHVVFSLVLPLVFLLLGGIGLPGGAVFIDRRAIKSRAAMSAVSAAGPLANLAIALVLALAITVGFRTGAYEFWAALAFLLFLQVTATVLNLLPVPGLDGFGIIEPYLPKALLTQAAKVAPFAILGLFALLWIPAVNSAFFGAIFGAINALGVPGILIGSGYNLFQF
ncbi:MAG: site-2 protease family protein, partial [Rhodoglobus sp.]